MDFKNMDMAQLEARKAEIAVECENEGADTSALLDEIRAITAEIEARKTAAAQQAEIRQQVANGAGETIKEERGDHKMDLRELRASAEYVNAFAEYIKTGKDEEVRALLSENAASGGQVPVPTIVDEVIRTAWEESKIMDRVNKTQLKGNVKVGFELSATGAVVHAEGAAAPTEETLTLGIVEMKPESIKKWITVSDESLDLTGEAFVRYIYRELAYRISKKAEEILIGLIVAASSTATATAVSVGEVAGAPSVGIVAEAIGEISGEAGEIVVMMNRRTWAQFKKAQYANKFNADPFENLEVLFTDALPAYAAAEEEDVYAIVGDLRTGAQANFPNGNEIKITMDEISLAEDDLVKFVGREFVGIGLVADKRFAKLTVPTA